MGMIYIKNHWQWPLASFFSSLPPSLLSFVKFSLLPLTIMEIIINKEKLNGQWILISSLPKQLLPFCCIGFPSPLCVFIFVLVELFESKLQTWSLNPEHFILHLLRGTTILLSHLGKLSVILYYPLIFRPHSSFPNCPRNIFYSFFVVTVIIYFPEPVSTSLPWPWLLWKRRETSLRKTDLI